jgi:hypothetical protein
VLLEGAALAATKAENRQRREPSGLTCEERGAVADRNAGEKSQGGKAPDEDTSSHSRWGLTAAEMREFCIKPVSVRCVSAFPRASDWRGLHGGSRGRPPPACLCACLCARGASADGARAGRGGQPSHFVIDAAIEEDILFLREERWPHSRGGRLQVARAPVPKAADSAQKPGMTKAQLHRMQHTAKWKEEFERRRLEEAEKAAASKKQREEFWAIKDKVQNALASDFEKKRKAAQVRRETMLQERKDFHNRTAEYKQTLDSKLDKIKSEHKLLMHVSRSQPPLLRLMSALARAAC